jgi:hypothetical protein
LECWRVPIMQISLMVVAILVLFIVVRLVRTFGTMSERNAGIVGMSSPFCSLAVFFTHCFRTCVEDWDFNCHMEMKLVWKMECSSEAYWSIIQGRRQLFYQYRSRYTSGLDMKFVSFRNYGVDKKEFIKKK